jgi:arginyl-tRNA synthetase
MNILTDLQSAFKAFATNTYGPHLPTQTFTLNVDEHRQQFGDVSTNAALLLAKTTKRKPIEIAHEIVTQFQHPAIAKIEVAGPGFLNIYLTEKSLHTLAAQLYTQGQNFFKPDDITHTYRTNIEFVSANPTGPLHFGHGRGGIIGDVLAQVLRFIGQPVHTEFYINDAGSQIEKLGKSFKIRCMQALGSDAQLPEDAYHGTYLIDMAQEYVREHGTASIEKPESFFAQYAKEKLLAYITQTLNNFGITFDTWFSEKTLHEQGLIAQALDVLKARGHLYEHEGALFFAATKFGDDKDRVVRKTSGELTYVAADIAYLLNKISRGYTRLIMILGHDHHSYVTRLHAVQKALGVEQYPLDIILYQLVSMKEDGQQVRMSKRAGTIVTLDDVVATVGTDVARYFYLQKKADAQLDFDIALALKHTDENPVYYIQYAYVRTNSILAKAAQDRALSNISDTDSRHVGISEALLLKKIASLQPLLDDIATTYHTYLLAQFAHELATLFHRYYSNNRVIDPEHPDTSRGRLLVVNLVHNTLDTLLQLLKLSRPEHM